MCFWLCCLKCFIVEECSCYACIYAVLQVKKCYLDIMTVPVRSNRLRRFEFLHKAFYNVKQLEIIACKYAAQHLVAVEIFFALKMGNPKERD